MRPEIIERITELMNAVERFKGHQIKITESISQDREAGHNRHWSTLTQFEFKLQKFGMTMSGAQLFLDGDSVTFYGISLDAIADFSVEEDGSLILIEYFEQKTERRTTITKPNAEQSTGKS